ncbi:MAG TPA: MarR family winged helix-turn-helix transcriptional regulator [Devosia sp.]|nr:MarR family winged helix-turn-helix transcriptional regulator [Devosia sp.]
MSQDPCICVALRKASRRLTARYDAAVAPAGISLAQFSLLRNVRRHAPLSITRLSQIVELDRSTLGRNLRVLARMGLLTLAPGADRRQETVSLTPAGQAVLARATPLWQAVQDDIRHTLGADGASRLEALLSAL